MIIHFLFLQKLSCTKNAGFIQSHIILNFIKNKIADE